MKTAIIFFILNTWEVLGLLVLVLVMLTIMFIVQCFFKWSEPDRKGKPIFFVKARENMAMFVMKSNKLHKAILASRKSVIDKDFNVIELVNSMIKKPKSIILDYFQYTEYMR